MFVYTLCILSLFHTILFQYSQCCHHAAFFAMLCSLSPCAETVAVQRNQNLCNVPMCPLPARQDLDYFLHSVCWRPAGATCSNTGSQPAEDTHPPAASAETPHSEGSLESGKWVGFVGRVLISTGTESAANYILDDFPVTATLKSAFSANWHIFQLSEGLELMKKTQGDYSIHE